MKPKKLQQGSDSAHTVSFYQFTASFHSNTLQSDTESTKTCEKTAKKLPKTQKKLQKSKKTAKKRRDEEFRIFFPPPRVNPPIKTPFRLHNTNCEHRDWISGWFFEFLPKKSSNFCLKINEISTSRQPLPSEIRFISNWMANFA